MFVALPVSEVNTEGTIFLFAANSETKFLQQQN